MALIFGGAEPQRHLIRLSEVTANPMATSQDYIDAFLKAAMIRRLADAGLKQEALASLMGISAPQLSQQLQPGAHISITRLLLAASDPDGLCFLQKLWHDVAEYLEIGDTDAVVAELKRFEGRIGWLADRIQTRMAKAEIRTVEAAHAKKTA